MIFNIISGGLISTITVNTAAGASVTCALSPFSYTVTANSNGVATFTVHMKGTWVITSSKNGLSASSTVSISGNGESKTLTLPLRTYLFKSGTGPVVPLTSMTHTTTSISLYGSVWVASTQDGDKVMMDVTKYSKVGLDGVENRADTDVDFWVLVGTSTAANPDIIDYFNPGTTRSTHYTDISSITGNMYVGLHYGSSWRVNVYNWWLEV